MVLNDYEKELSNVCIKIVSIFCRESYRFFPYLAKRKKHKYLEIILIPQRTKTLHNDNERELPNACIEIVTVFWCELSIFSDSILVYFCKKKT